MNDFEHLQSVYRQIHNQQVNEFFRNVEVPEIIEDIRNVPPEASLKKACLVKDNDTATVLMLRLDLFNKLKGNQNNILVDSYRRSTRRRHKPQVTLWFIEDLDDVVEGYESVDGRISFRLMDASTDDISESQARTLATRIKANFGLNNGFVWRKGKEMISYSDWDKGYQLQLLCRNKAEGKRVIEQVLNIQEDNPEWENMNHIVNENSSERYPTLPPSKPILGRPQRMPRERPIADVRFTVATLTIRGMQQPLILYGLGGYSGRGLVS